MKLLFTIAILTIAAVAVNSQGPIQLSEGQKQRIIEYAAVCGEKNSVDKDTIQGLRAGRFENANRNVKCFTNCFLDKAGLFVNGQVQHAVIMEKLGSIFGADKVKAAISKCNGVKGADNCETAFELYKCYYKTNAGLI